MRIVIFVLMAAALVLAQDKKDTKQSKDTGKSEPPKTAPSEVPKSEQIPKGAIRVEPNLYRYVDPQGKTWFYRQLPFGVSKYEDKPAEPTAVSEQPAAIVRDLGDSVEFQRQTPFGVSKWIRKKADLTDEEKGLIAADEAKRAAPPKEGDRPPAAKTATDKSAEKKQDNR
jgi:hypothetical protein